MLGAAFRAPGSAAPTAPDKLCQPSLGSITAASPAAAAQPPPSAGAVSGPDPGHARRCGPWRRRRAAQSTDHKRDVLRRLAAAAAARPRGERRVPPALRGPRQPHGPRRPARELFKSAAGRARRAAGTGAPGRRDPAGPARAGAVGARGLRAARVADEAYARGHGGGAAVDKRRQLSPPPPASPPRNYDPLETATSTLNVDDDYAAAVDDAYEDVEPSSARRRRTVSPVKRRVRDEAPPQKRGDERNEDLVRKPRDQLYYSRKARAVSNFRPYTLHEYRKTKPKEYIEFEPLRPNLNEDPALRRSARRPQSSRPTRRGG